jgi:ABC-type sugar transport system permease subunit
MTTAALDVPSDVERSTQRREPGGSSRPPLATMIKYLVFGTLGVLVVIYIGPGEIGEMLLKIAAALAISTGLFVGANKLFDLTYDRWTLFSSITGFAVGFVVFLILDGNRLLRDVSPRPWAWALMGGVAAAAVMFALSAPRQERVRLPVAVAGFAGLGVLVALSIDESWQPSLDWAKLFGCTAIGVGAGVLICLLGGRRGLQPRRLADAALVGGGIGWLVGAWGGAEFAGAGTLGEALIATVIPLSVIGLRVGLSAVPEATERREIEQRSRSWIFVTPALAFVAGGLLVPLVRTIYISFKGRTSVEFVGTDNYEAMFDDPNFFDVDNWPNIFTSQLWWFGVGVVAAGVLIGVVVGRTTKRVFESGPSSLLPIVAGLFLISCAVLSVLRGTLFNNIWWVIVVTTLATAFGLAVAVLADRAGGENVAKSMIFLPMAISFVGAGVIWRFMYQPRNVQDEQTGVLNAIWVGLGELSNSGWQKWLVAAALAAIIAFLAWLAWNGVTHGNNTRAGFSIGVGLILAFLLYRLLGPGLGGFRTTEDGEVVPETIEFLAETPFNNMWLMVILIWIQTGFAMVIFSSAIKAVPTELTEAAKIDGATESQVFWRVTLPQILPTVGVVVTTLIVLVMKVFDIVKVTTNGQFGSQVIANQMFDAISIQSNFGLGAALATALFLAVLPVMYLNIRRMQKAKV